jgi:hypothetical protein
LRQRFPAEQVRQKQSKGYRKHTWHVSSLEISV